MNRTGDKMEETKMLATEAKNLDQRVEFSWKSVFRGWIQNLKDDIDPAIVGAKMGLFGIHAVPSWIRHSEEGKMSSDKLGLTSILGLVVGGSSIAGYVALGKYINARSESQIGYEVIGIPVASQALSWAYEAFLKAKKSVQSRVIMTRLQHTFESVGKNYDLSNVQLAKLIETELYNKLEKEIDYRKRCTLEKIEEHRTNLSAEKDDKERERQCKFIRTYEEEIASFAKVLKMYKPLSEKYGRETVFYSAKVVFNGLVADSKLGKVYQLSPGLETGPEKRKKERDLDEWLEDERMELEEDIRNGWGHALFAIPERDSAIKKSIREAVELKKGPLGVELFGVISPVYADNGTILHYEVQPNKEIWQA